MIMNKPLSLSNKNFLSLSNLIRQSFTTLLFSTILLLFSSCTTTKLLKETYSNPEVLPIEVLAPSPVKWEPIQDGFEISGDVVKTQRVSWHCVRIDLDNPKLSIVYAPHEDSLGQLFNVKDFARQFHTVVAINAAPFLIETTNYPVGILKDGDNLISPVNTQYCALAFYRDENHHLRAEILNKQEEALDSKYTYAFGGFFTTYENGSFKKFQHNKRSRVGCGTSCNGRYLYIMVTTPFFHPTDRNGLNYEECSLIFQKLGCDKAMQFDGGHSSALLVYTKDIEKPFMQRKVPTALGFVTRE